VVEEGEGDWPRARRLGRLVFSYCRKFWGREGEGGFECRRGGGF
jgi:hypothetical protein